MRSARTCSVPEHRIGPRGRTRDAATLRRLSPRRQPDRVTTISLPSCRFLRDTPRGAGSPAAMLTRRSDEQRASHRSTEPRGSHRRLDFPRPRCGPSWFARHDRDRVQTPAARSTIAGRHSPRIACSTEVEGEAAAPKRGASASEPSSGVPRFPAGGPITSSLRRPVRSTPGLCSADESDVTGALLPARLPVDPSLGFGPLRGSAGPSAGLALSGSTPPATCLRPRHAPRGATRRSVASVRRGGVLLASPRASGLLGVSRRQRATDDLGSLVLPKKRPKAALSVVPPDVPDVCGPLVQGPCQSSRHVPTPIFRETR